jgi:hypothetical protein
LAGNDHGLTGSEKTASLVSTSSLPYSLLPNRLCFTTRPPICTDARVIISSRSGTERGFAGGADLAALYEQSGVHHVGTFAELEDQLTSFTADIDRAKLGSPDRVDALVWALTELMVEKMPWEGLYNYYRERAAEVALENAAPQ